MIITSAETQKNNSNRISVYVDGKYHFTIDEEDWFRLNLYVGKEISEKEIKEINETRSFSRAKKIAIKFSIFKKRTEFEVKTKLKQSGFDGSTIEKVIRELKVLQYIDDTTYTEKYIKDALNLKKIGIHRINVELQRKGVDEAIIQNQLSKLEVNETQRLKPLLQKKLTSVKTIDEKSLNKIKNYFIGKGYDLNVINQSIKDILSATEEKI